MAEGCRSSGEQAQPSGNPAIPANHQPADINPVAPQLPSQGVQQTPLEPAAPPPSHASIPIIDSAAAVSTSSAAPPLPHSTTQAAPSQQPPSSPAAGGEGPQASPHPRSHARSTTEALPAVPLGGSNAAAAAPGCASERGSGGAAQHLTALSSAASADWGARKYMEDRWVIQEDARQRREGRTRVSFFCTIDGHGGQHSAEFVMEHLHLHVMAADLVPPALVCHG
ncbi:MAG: hypothetical protein WDW36_001195 [Sanguina aurantia]